MLPPTSGSRNGTLGLSPARTQQMHLKFIFFRVDFQKAELFSLKLLASGDDFIFKSGLDVHSDNASFRCLSFKSSGLTHLHA